MRELKFRFQNPRTQTKISQTFLKISAEGKASTHPSTKKDNVQLTVSRAHSNYYIRAVLFFILHVIVQNALHSFLLFSAG